MVYKKYIRKNGKLVGPYYYESYRENGKIKSRYLGTKLPEAKPELKERITSLRILLGIMIALFILSLIYIGYLTNFKLTGNAVLSIEESYTFNQFLGGNVKLVIGSGDSLQKDLQVNLALEKDGNVVVQTSKTLEEFLGTQINYTEITNVTQVCSNEEYLDCVDDVITRENCTSPETVCINETVTHENCEVVDNETLCNNTEEIVPNCTSPERVCGNITENIENCTTKSREVNCTAQNTTDYFYNTEGTYYIPIESLISYNLTEAGNYSLIFSIQSLNLSTETNFVIGNTTNTTNKKEPVNLQAMDYLNCPDISGFWNVTVDSVLSNSINCSVIIIQSGVKVIANSTLAGNAPVNITTNNLTIALGGALTANLTGYTGGASQTNGNGPGAGIFSLVLGNSGGAGHGGYGGRGYCTGGCAYGGGLYGSALYPLTLGSGGAGGNTGGFTGGGGGGAIFINASDTVNITGVLSANGGLPILSQGAGGAGGSIYIFTNNFIGTGTLSAKGAGSRGSSGDGNGAGGRIAVYYNTNAFSGDITVKGGVNTSINSLPGMTGTIVFADRDDNMISLPGEFRWQLNEINQINSYSTINLTNAYTRFNESGISISTNNLLMTNSTINAMTGSITNDYNLVLNISFNISVINLTIDGLSSINLSNAGYSGGLFHENGDGFGGGIAYVAGGNAGGASYGGYGSRSANTPAFAGAVYGSVLQPIWMGSGGSGGNTAVTSNGGNGGGAIFINATNVIIDGAICANSGNMPLSQGAGGSGGSIYILANNFSGTGNLSARGGNAGSTSTDGPGGGGRIAVYYNYSTFAGKLDVSGGLNGSSQTLPASKGSVVLINLLNSVYNFTSLSSLTEGDLIANANTILIIGQNITVNASVYTLNSTYLNISGSQWLNKSLNPRLSLVYNNSFNDLNSRYANLSLSLEKSGAGRIDWLVNLTANNLSSNVNISANNVYVNSTAVSGLNRSANITLRGLSFLSPVMRVDTADSGSFAVCNSTTTPKCVNISYSGGIFVFNVSGFTTYQAAEGGSIVNMSQIFVNSSSGLNSTDEALTCWAMATDSNAATVSYNGSWYKNGVQNQSFDTSPQYYAQNISVNVSTIYSDKTATGENWSCLARAYNGINYSSLLMSENLTVLALPAVSNVILSSSRGRNYSNENISVNFALGGLGFTYGDLNNDSIVNNTDINIMVNYLLLINPPASGTDAFNAADVDGDGNLTSADNNWLVDKTLGRINRFPAELRATIINWYKNDSSITVLNMPFEGGSNGTFTEDYSGFGNNGSVVNAVWNSTGGYDKGGAYEFNGINSRIAIRNDSFNSLYVNGNGKITLSAWFKFASLNGYYSKIIDVEGYYTIDRTSDNKIELFYTGSSSDAIFSNTTVVPNRWYHVAGVYDGTYQKLYINGVLENQSAVTLGNLTAENSSTYIGARFDLDSLTGTFFNGTIDNVKIFNLSLSAQQVYRLFENRTDSIAPSELQVGKSWKALVTPNYGTKDGVGVFSNIITIQQDPTEITNCIDLSTANQTYIMTADVVSDAGRIVCINITAVNVTLDCRGHSILFGSGVGGVGVSLRNADNITVMNCNITKNGSTGVFNQGIQLLSGADSAQIINNTIVVNGSASNFNMGIYANNSLGTTNYTTIENNTIIANLTNFERGIWFDSGVADNSIIRRNRIYHMSHGGGAEAVKISGSTKNALFDANVIFLSDLSYGIQVAGVSTVNCTNCIYKNNIMTMSPIGGFYGISIEQTGAGYANNLTITNNTLVGLGYAVYVYTTGSNISNNNITNHQTYGINLAATSTNPETNNIIYDNYINSNTTSGYGIYLGSGSGGANYNLVRNNTVIMRGTGTSVYGLSSSEGSSYNDIIGNYFFNGNNTAAGILSMGPNNEIINNTVILEDKGNTGISLSNFGGSNSVNTTVLGNIVNGSIATNVAYNSTIKYNNIITTKTGISMSACYNYTIYNNNISAQLSGIIDSGSGAYNCTILNNNVYANVSGILTSGLAGGNNIIRYNNVTVSSTTCGVGNCYGIGAYRAEVIYNNVSGVGSSGAFIGFAPFGSSNFSYNYLYSNISSATAGVRLYSGQNIFSNNILIINSSMSAFSFPDSFDSPINNTAANNIIIGKGSGIRPTDFYYNNTFINNSFSLNCSAACIGVQARGAQNTFINNSFIMNSSAAGSYGIDVNSQKNGTFSNNYVFLNSTGASYGIYIESSGNNNTFINDKVNTTGCPNIGFGATSRVNVSFTNVLLEDRVNFTSNYISQVSIDVNKTPTSLPANRVGIGKYLTINSLTTPNYIMFNVSYLASDIVGFAENTLRMYRYNQTSLSWELLTNSTLDTANKVVSSGNISSFSLFAPLGIVNNAPNVTNVTLSSTYGTNTTSENLTATYNVSDSDWDSIKNITNWYRNGNSIMVLNMPFEGGSNSTFTRDYSGFENNGSVVNAVWNSTGGYDGFGAYQFNGNNSYLNITDSFSLRFAANSFSLEARIKLNPVFSSNTTAPNIIDKWSGSKVYRLGVNASGYPYIWIRDSSLNQAFAYASTAVNDSSWHHIIGMRDANTLRIYVDGVQQGTADASAVGAVDGTFPLIIGYFPQDDSQKFNGTIDDIRIYNRSLSAQQASALYGNRTDLIVSNELTGGDIWKACVTANDRIADGNTLCSNNVSIIDAINPLVTIASPSATTYTTATTSVDIRINEAGYCEYSLDSGATNLTLTANSSNTGFTGTTISLANGDYTLNAYCNDTSGNKNYTQNVSFTINVASTTPSTPGGGGGGGPACTPVYEYGDWSGCVGGKQTRTRSDTKCGYASVTENQNCEMPLCAPDWSCTSWGSCTGGVIKRTCTDSNGCNLESERPAEESACGTERGQPGCTSDFRCEEWGPCSYTYSVKGVIENQQLNTGQSARVCYDIKGCANNYTEYQNCTSTIPIEIKKVESCNESVLEAVNTNTGVPVSLLNVDSWNARRLDISFTQSKMVYCPNCYNGMLDGEEEGIDCGGSCKACRACKVYDWIKWVIIIAMAVIILSISGYYYKERENLRLEYYAWHYQFKAWYQRKRKSFKEGYRWLKYKILYSISRKK